jgi:hypothetical protein
VSRANVAALVARYGHPRAGRAVRLGEPPTTATVRPMGPLVELTLTRFRDGERETWTFDPRPRLVFTRRTKRLWVLGGGFKIDGDGFHNHHGASGLRRERVEVARNDPAMQPQLREFHRTHSNLDPIEAVSGVIRAPRAVVALGTLASIVYRTDRRDGDGRSEWIHHMEDEGVAPGRAWAPPMVLTDPAGTGLYFAGGTYRVIDGWLAG